MMSDAEYKKQWENLGPIEIRMVEKTGKCRHELGEAFRYENPYRRPEGVCNALLYVLDLLHMAMRARLSLVGGRRPQRLPNSLPVEARDRVGDEKDPCRGGRITKHAPAFLTGALLGFVPVCCVSLAFAAGPIPCKAPACAP